VPTAGPAASSTVPPTAPGLDTGLHTPLWATIDAQTSPLLQSEVISQRSPSPWLHPAQKGRAPAKAQARLIARRLDSMGSWVSTGARVCEGRKR
jgi:hypothetical protein